MNDRFFDKTRDFYAKLDRDLGDKVKECVTCRRCCEHAQIPYRGFEVDYIFEHLFRLGRADLFEGLLNLGDNWGKTGIACLFYDKNKKVCMIQSVRPYNCRVFGPYSDEELGLPEECCYNGATIPVPRDKVAETLPLFDEYHGLAHEYQVYLKSEDEEKK